MKLLIAFLLAPLLAPLQEAPPPQPAPSELAGEVRAALGLELAPTHPESELRPGLRIVAVVPYSNGHDAGLREGDVLLQLDDEILGDLEDLAEALRGRGEEEHLSARAYRRRGGAWREHAVMLRITPPSPEELVARATGIEFAVLMSRIRRSIVSTDSPFGLAISAVAPGSPAAVLGLEPGDLLMKWKGEPIRTVGELARWIATCEPGAAAAVEVARRKRVGLLSRHPWETLELELELARPRTHGDEEREPPSER